MKYICPKCYKKWSFKELEIVWIEDVYCPGCDKTKIVNRKESDHAKSKKAKTNTG